MNDRIYLDWNATAPTLDVVREAMIAALTGAPGNASSIHREGQRARSIVERARRAVARAVSAPPQSVVLNGGATEGNNMLINLTGRPGMVGRLMMGAQLLRCDPETGEPLRNDQGFCESARVGEVGLYIAPNSKLSPFDGYADKEATRKKLLSDVFKKGDSWFNSGDLMTLHDDQWVAFADRVGDTFRWKAENVSTTEVGEILNGAPGVLETNVYGVEVPGADGRAGMASVHVGEGFSIEALARFAVENLASYQRPVFVRLQEEMELTVTLKHQKVGYRRDGYDPSKVSDPLYLLEGDTYTKLDGDVYAQLQDGRKVIR